MSFWDEHSDLLQGGGASADSGGGYLLNGLGSPDQQAPSVGGYEVPAETAPTPAAAPPPAAQGAQVGHNDTYNGMTREQYRDAWMSSGVNSMQGMRDWLAKNGGTLVSDNGTVRTPFGETLDMGGNARGSMAGHGALTPSWGGSGGGGSATAPTTGAGMMTSGGAPSLGGGYSAPPAASAGQSGHLGGSFSPFVYKDFHAPDAFKAPTAEQALNDPGYQFRLAQGQKAMTNAAAKGGLLASGDFAKGMTDYNQNSASQEYQNYYGRAAQEYDRMYGNAFQENQANNAGGLGAFTANTNADLGYGNLANAENQTANSYALGQGQIGLGYHTADQNYALGQGQLGLGYHTADQNYALGQGQLGLGYYNGTNANNLGWANYGINAQGQNFNQQYLTADLGLRASGQAGQYGSSYANGAGNAISGYGNAQAGGYAAGGAAYGGALQNAGNTALGYGLYRGVNAPHTAANAGGYMTQQGGLL